MPQQYLDTAVFEELSEATGDEFAAELVTTFLGDAGNMFADLRQAANAQDGEAYRRAAHSIKSNAQTFGAGPLADAARQMELSGDTDATAIDALEDLFQQTAATLQRLLNG